ncbi:MAG TPA: cation:proton antiporter [Candidatus Aenigmarchaeota archaeon]|nr:MAG: cation:proton antiporter [Candidatus Aenigmarchaeota archaeon]HDD46406.1 cation:proton antiporter [Candidatus Aenigmarchaeota archaeon]
MIDIQFLTVVILISVGISTLVFKKNIIKIVMGIEIISSSINLFLISLGYREGSVAPIFTNAPSVKMVLPTPQALTLTNIVIDLAITALMLSLAVLIYNYYGTLSMKKWRLVERCS